MLYIVSFLIMILAFFSDLPIGGAVVVFAFGAILFWLRRIADRDTPNAPKQTFKDAE